MYISVVNVADKDFLAFVQDGITSIICDVATGNGLRCSNQGSLKIKAGANCSQPLSFVETEQVDYPNQVDAEILFDNCSLDGDMMDMTMRLVMGNCVASKHVGMVLVNGTGSYLIPEWELSEQ